MVSEPERVKVQRLDASTQLGKIIRNYGLKSMVADKLPWKKTAWGTAGFPMELFWAYDIYALHPENSACVAGVRKISQEMIEYAESTGYSRDLCSYMKTNVGAVDKKIKMSLGGIPKPTFAASTNTVCDTHVKWFQIQARKMKVPYFAIDVPSYVSGCDEERMDEYTDYIVEQFYDYMDFVKKHTGKDLDRKKFRSIIAKSDRLAELWHEIYEYRKLLPAPFVFQDTLASIFPLVVLPGLDVGVKFYEAILAELKERAKDGIGSVPAGKEKYRLVFEGIPLWYRTKYLHELSNLGANVVYEPYTLGFGPRKKQGLSFDKSLKDMAKVIINNPYIYNLETRIKYFKQVIDDYSIDGVILHSNMSCRPSATGMIDLKNAIQRDKGVPVWLMTSDMNDPRAYSEAQMRTRMEAFVEQMESNKI